MLTKVNKAAEDSWEWDYPQGLVGQQQQHGTDTPVKSGFGQHNTVVEIILKCVTPLLAWIQNGELISRLWPISSSEIQTLSIPITLFSVTSALNYLPAGLAISAILVPDHH